MHVHLAVLMSQYSHVYYLYISLLFCFINLFSGCSTQEPVMSINS
jgi:hypothetical protein